MAFCTKCGASNSDDCRFCTACGAPVEETVSTPDAQPPVNESPAAEVQQPAPEAAAAAPDAQPQTPYAQTTFEQPYQQYYQNAYQQQTTAPQPGYAPVPEKKAEVSIGMYIGCFFLFAVPVVGLIFAIVWACGGIANKSIVNYARAILIMWAIALVLSIIATVVVITVVMANYDSLQDLMRELLDYFKTQI